MPITLKALSQNFRRVMTNDKNQTTDSATPSVKFPKLVLELLNSKGHYESRQRLHEIKEALQLKVLYSSKKKNQLLRNRKALLAVWSFCLDEFQSSNQSEEDELLCQNIIEALLDRDEFGLEDMKVNALNEAQWGEVLDQIGDNSFDVSTFSLTGSQGSDDGNATTDSFGQEQESWKDLQHYRKMLWKTFRLVCNVSSKLGGEKVARTQQDMEFLARITSVVFMRLPIIQDKVIKLIVTAQENKVWEYLRDEFNILSNSSAHINSNVKSKLLPESHQKNLKEIKHKPKQNLAVSSQWPGPTFAQNLSKWTEINGLICSERSTLNNHYKFQTTSSGTALQYCKGNPSIFLWGNFGPIADKQQDRDEMYRDCCSTLDKLVHDGEFFLTFVAKVTQYLTHVSRGDVIWSQAPHYATLIKISLLLINEAAYRQWCEDSNKYESVNTKSSSSSGTDVNLPNSISNQSTNQPTFTSTPNHSSNPQTVKHPTNNRKTNSKIGSSRITYFNLTTRGVKTVMSQSNILLLNHDLINSCILGLFESTNIYNSRSVGFCLNQLEQWIAAIALRSNSHGFYYVPLTFNGTTLMTGLRIMLQSESFEILKKVLLFLYKRMDYFIGDLRQGVLKQLVTHHFQLFLHWHVEVRYYYHHILVYKISRLYRTFFRSCTDNLLVGELVNSVQVELPAYVVPDDYNTGGPNNEEKVGNQDIAAGVERAIWRAFDACISIICMEERRHAPAAQRAFQFDILCAKYRRVAFQHLRKDVDANGNTAGNTNGLSSMNEGRPSSKLSSNEVDQVDAEVQREAPYYLRYLPASELDSLESLSRMIPERQKDSVNVYPRELRVYNRVALQNYSEILKAYYTLPVDQNGTVELPPLGFC